MTEKRLRRDRKATLLKLLGGLLGRSPRLPPELQRGRELVAAIDAGGIPLNPAIVNRIARDLGLEVGASAPVEQTVERIRAAVERGLQSLAVQAENLKKPKGGSK